jgi:hypothetical protein
MTDESTTAETTRPTALVTTDPARQARLRELRVGTAFVPSTFGEAMEYAAILASCSLLPKNCTREDALIRILFGVELGFSVPQALQNVAVINGKAQVYGDTPLALVFAKRRLELEHFSEGWEAETRKGLAWCEVQRAGRELVRREFSIQDAEETQVWADGKLVPLISKGVWRGKAYQRRMCKFKARNEALRDTFPDVLLGITSEEDADIPSLYAIDGEVVRSEPARVAGATPKTLDELLADMPDDVRAEVTKGFDELAFSPAQRSVWIRKYATNDALRKALRDEWMLRRTNGEKRAAGLRTGPRPVPVPVPANHEAAVDPEPAAWTEVDAAPLDPLANDDTSDAAEPNESVATPPVDIAPDVSDIRF